MIRLYSYIVKNDNGSAPNPFWGICTLTICKPVIRRTARVGDWVIGTGSKNSKLKDGKIHDLSASLVYAMKITDKKTLLDYDSFCVNELNNKIPNWFSKDWRMRMGDCIYEYTKEEKPTMRRGVHKEQNRKKDLSGLYALLSNHFYYFGEEARPLPKHLKDLIKKSQGHLRIENENLIREFTDWISRFKKNKIYADPQRKWLFNLISAETQLSTCSDENLKDDNNQTERVIC